MSDLSDPLETEDNDRQTCASYTHTHTHTRAHARTYAHVHTLCVSSFTRHSVKGESKDTASLSGVSWMGMTSANDKLWDGSKYGLWGMPNRNSGKCGKAPMIGDETGPPLPLNHHHHLQIDLKENILSGPFMQTDYWFSHNLLHCPHGTATAASLRARLQLSHHSHTLPPCARALPKKHVKVVSHRCPDPEAPHCRPCGQMNVCFGSPSCLIGGRRRGKGRGRPGGRMTEPAGLAYLRAHPTGTREWCAALLTACLFCSYCSALERRGIKAVDGGGPNPLPWSLPLFSWVSVVRGRGRRGRHWVWCHGRPFLERFESNWQEGRWKGSGGGNDTHLAISQTLLSCRRGTSN